MIQVISRRPGAWRLAALVVAVWLAGWAAPAAAQDRDVVRLGGSITGGGINIFAQDKWALVKARVVNDSDADRVFRVVWSFAIEPGRQFVRRVWVPARAERQIVWPARLGQLPPDAKAAEGTALLLADDAEVSYDDEPGTVIAVQYDRLTSAIAGDNDAAIAGVMAVREARGLGRGMNYPSAIQDSAPRFTLGWEPIEVIALADGDVRFDGAQRRALRRWLRAGGTLWVMLDAVDADAMAQLLGDDWGVEPVDRVSFNRVRFDPAGDEPGGASPTAGSLTDEPVVVERPLAMVRVVAPAFEPVIEVRRWPALMQRRIGAGRLIVSTVEPRAWTDRRAEATLRTIGDVVYARQPSELSTVTAAATDPFIEAAIGYQVVGRTQIALVLGGYLAAFVVLGVVLLARRRGERVAAWGLAMAVVTGLVLLGVGLVQRGKVQPAASMLQVVHIEPGSVAATVRGAMGLFTPFERETTIGSRRGGWAWPRDGAGGDTRRLMWTDLDFWQWQGLELSGGAMRTMDLATTSEFDRPFALDARFDAQGLVATARWPGGAAPNEVTLLTPNGPMAVTVGQADANGAHPLTVADQRLRPGAFIGAAVMSQTRRNRNQVLAAMHDQPGWPDRPLLAAWTPLIDDGLSTGELPKRGQALWLTPVELRRSAPGQAVRIPAAWMTMTPLRRVEGDSRSAALYDPRRRVFVEMSYPSMVVARFTPPPAVRPIDLTAATLHLDAVAANRPVQIIAYHDGQPIVLATLQGIDGPRRIDLPAAKLPATDGAVTLVVRIGPTAGGAVADTLSGIWQVKRIGLEIAGVVLPPPDRQEP